MTITMTTDEMDQLQLYIDAARRIHANKDTTVSEFQCESCKETIPEARRIAIPGVNLCVNCSERLERK